MSSKEDSSSPYFKRPTDVGSTSALASSSSVASSLAAPSVYKKSTFFRNPSTSTASIASCASVASNSSSAYSSEDRTLAGNKSTHYSSEDRTLAGNKSVPYYSSSSASLASCSSASLSDFKVNKRGARTSFDTSSLATPGRARGANTTAANNSSFYGEPVNADCIVAIVEGRGSARGEVGLASISLTSPALILCQFSDSRTYVRTLTKIAVLNPAEIITPNGLSSFSNPDSSMTKLYNDINEKFPGASLTQVHRKYFSETRGLQMVKHLCAREYSSVELQLRHKYYALAAAACLLKYVEFIENIIYAPKVICNIKLDIKVLT